MSWIEDNLYSSKKARVVDVRLSKGKNSRSLLSTKLVCSAGS